MLDFTKPIRRIKQLYALGGAGRGVLLHSAICLPVFNLALRVYGLARVQTWLAATPVKAQQPLTPAQVRDLGHLVNVAAHRTLGANSCLTRSVVLVWLLHRRGVQAQLRIGVQRAGAALSAHAWVEHNGIPVNDHACVGDQYAVFDGEVALKNFQTP